MKSSLAKRKLVVLLIVVVAISIGVITVQKFNKETKELDMIDYCTSFQGSIIYTIKDEAACRVQCRSQCEAIDYNFKESNFQSNDIGSCNDCKCFCER